MKVHRIAIAFLALGLAACGDRGLTTPTFRVTSGGASATVTVSAANPDSAPQDTTLDVHVLGGGFDRGSNAQWAQSGVVSPNVKTNATRFVSSSELVANITIAISATTGSYDIVVTTSKGKKGIGSELFTIRKGTRPPPPADPAIVFTGNSGLMVMNGDGSNQVAIVPASAFDKFTGGASQPSWSPDGKSVVFEAGIGGVGGTWITDVSVVDGTPVGGNLRHVDITFPPGSQLGCCMAWSPSGDAIAVNASSAQWDRNIYVFPPTGGAATIVYTSPDGFIPEWPDWSPDASKLVFVESSIDTNAAPVQRAIVVWDRSTSTRTVILPFSTAFFPRFVSWSRKGDQIAYSGYSGNNPEGVYIIPAIGGTPVRVADGSYPTWAPDDSRLLFHGGSHNTSGLYTFTLGTGTVQPLGAAGDRPDWRRF